MPSHDHVAAALGWSGTVVTDLGVLGQHVAAVVRLNHEVHRWRTRNGWPPEPDPSFFRSWFEPALHDQVPVPAVDLVGVLISETEPHRALESCGSLLTLAPCAVLLPEHSDPWPLIELDYYGVGVVTPDSSGNPRVEIPPEDRSAEFGPSLFGRWLREVLYGRVLDFSPQSARTPR